MQALGIFYSPQDWLASVALYRSYLSLATRDLLYRQSELNELQEQLARFDQDDAAEAKSGNREVKDMAMDWQRLCEEPLKSRAARRKKLIFQIRENLKEYRPSSGFPGMAAC